MIKKFAFAAAATVALTSVAAADGAFSYNEADIAGATAEIGQVRTTAAGVVSLYDYNTGVQGALLGTQNVEAGANYDVRVNIGKAPINDVIAVLTINGEVVDTAEFDTVR